MSAKTAIVSGALANKPGNGGGTWERMSWLLGLQRLGCDVYFVEQIDEHVCKDPHGNVAPFVESVNLAWFQSVSDWFGIADRASLILDNGNQAFGIALPQLIEIAESADLLVNLSGHLTFGPLFDRIRHKAYIDVDPGFTQFWQVDENARFDISAHDSYFTIGENIGARDCSIPTGGLPWRSIRQPVLLDQWPSQPSESLDRFTTVASWRGAFGSISVGGKSYGLKAHTFRRFAELPNHCKATFELALDIHPADRRDRQLLEQNGWRIVDPRRLAEPEAFRRYLQESDAEFSIAQGVYADTNSGWFSERSARYLAAGKPVLVQETGFSRRIPTGEGLLSFRTLEEAVRGAEALATDYASHSKAAREIAEQYFDSDVVLSRFLNEVEMQAPVA